MVKVIVYWRSRLLVFPLKSFELRRISRAVFSQISQNLQIFLQFLINVTKLLGELFDCHQKMDPFTKLFSRKFPFHLLIRTAYTPFTIPDSYNLHSTTYKNLFFFLLLFNFNKFSFLSCSLHASSSFCLVYLIRYLLINYRLSKLMTHLSYLKNVFFFCLRF